MQTKRSLLPYEKCSSRTLRSGDGPGHPCARRMVDIRRLSVPIGLSDAEPFIGTLPRYGCVDLASFHSPSCLATPRLHPSGDLEGTKLVHSCRQPEVSHPHCCSAVEHSGSLLRVPRGSRGGSNKVASVPRCGPKSSRPRFTSAYLTRGRAVPGCRGGGLLCRLSAFED